MLSFEARQYLGPKELYRFLRFAAYMMRGLLFIMP